MENRNLVVLYGSQTGTAQDLAERVGREALRYRFDVKVMEMDDFVINQLPEQRLVVFVCSTTGQGEEPDNMKKSWRFLLRKNLPSDSLAATKFGVLGLGDSSYQKFNFAAKKLHKRLLQLGAMALLNPALGDEQHELGQDAAVNPWLDEFWAKAMFVFPLPESIQPFGQDFLPPSKYSVIFAENPFKSIAAIGNGSGAVFFAPVKQNRRVTAIDHFQDVRLISFDLTGSSLTYSPGDVAMVQPQNSNENVDKFFQIFATKFDRNQIVSLEANWSETKLPPDWILPSPFTLEDCARRWWDLSCTPRRTFFQLLAKFSTDELEHEKLLEMSSTEGQQDLYNYCNRPRRTLVEVLFDFQKSACQLPLAYLFDLIPAIKPRAFSIASSLKTDPHQLEILVAIVEYKTKLVNPRKGICSTWLSRLVVGDRVPLWVRPGTFRFPVDPKVPVIMIGPGTGCSPFRSYIDDQKDTDRELCLFFGCRSSSGDFFFRDEWFRLREQGRLQLFTAFSRDQQDKIYVQHRMEEQRSLMRQLLVEKRAWVFVAGNAKQMPDQVTQAVKDALDDSNEFDQLISQSRLQLETWS